MDDKMCNGHDNRTVLASLMFRIRIDSFFALPYIPLFKSDIKRGKLKQGLQSDHLSESPINTSPRRNKSLANEYMCMMEQTIELWTKPY